MLFFVLGDHHLWLVVGLGGSEDEACANHALVISDVTTETSEMGGPLPGPPPQQGAAGSCNRPNHISAPATLVLLS